MKVAELIAVLQTMPMDAECVSYEFTTEDYVPIVQVEQTPQQAPLGAVFLYTQNDLDEQ